MSDERRPRLRARTPGGDVLVLGLGRFGTAVAETLEAGGRRVLGVDESAERVRTAAPKLSQALVADVTDPEVLDQIGAAEFTTAIVCIGEDMEASILATAALVDLGVPAVWARGVNDAHARILTRVGAHHVVQPLRDHGRRLAQLVSGNLVEYLPLDDGFSIIEVVATPAVSGRSLAELEVRRRFGVTVVCVKPPGGTFTYTTAATVLAPGELVVVAAANDDLRRFAAFLEGH